MDVTRNHVPVKNMVKLKGGYEEQAAIHLEKMEKEKDMLK
jgi:hypothetical protein